ncbi:hypothetical protein ACH5RR_022035 [Cinchona calisaya]|uniref:Homeobox domain-containing protein n=1 Tax=Cinchona calisaya TaxID=153742 RepID=A0ABD2ZBP6_9GENT
MAAYFPSSDNERDISTMLHLREPLPCSYSNTPVLPGNLMMYMNYTSSGTLAGNLQHQSSGIANLPGASSSNTSEQEIQPELGGLRIAEHDLNEWKSSRNSMLLMYPGGDAAGVFQNPQNRQIQGLSLSLSTNIPSGFQVSSLQCSSPNPTYSSLLSTNPLMPGEDTGRNGYFENLDCSQSKQSRHSEYASPGFPGSNSDPIRADVSPYGIPSIARAVPSSKYLKAAQQLLDEVVNVRKALKEQHLKHSLVKDSKELDGGSKPGESDHPECGSSSNVQESSSNSASELSAAEKQDLQNKMSKLLAMIDEVDRRYKQYYHQMQIVVSSFDVIAGSGAARPYTALALQTISRHFRCLRDAINEQVQVTRKSLGEQDASASSKGIGISRLRYVDLQIKQQRALQQLGMMQQHAWRPQRGLPESSVTVLRAWLFEHFLHPYPKDSDKIMLARQTGLTRSQVSNWFINARVRLWKPMVEEMYKEESIDAEMDSNSPYDVAAKTANSDTKEPEDLLQSTTSTATDRGSADQLLESNSDYFPDVEMMEPNISQSFENVSHTDTGSECGLGGQRAIQRPAMSDCNILPDTTSIQSIEDSGRYMAAATAAYQISELERFENSSGVSLTLGLQRGDGSSVPMSIETHHNYITMRGDGTYSGGAEAAEFDCMDTGNRHDRFGSSQLLHDFVA